MINVKRNSADQYGYESVRLTPKGMAYAAATSSDVIGRTLLLEATAPVMNSETLGIRRSRIKLQGREGVPTSAASNPSVEMLHTTLDLSLNIPVGLDSQEAYEMCYQLAEMLKDKTFLDALARRGRTQFSEGITITPVELPPRV